MQVKEDQFFVVTPPGLEQITATELKKLTLEVDSVLRGGILFRGGIAGALSRQHVVTQCITDSGTSGRGRGQ